MESKTYYLCIIYLFNIIICNIVEIKRKINVIYKFSNKSIGWIRKNWKSKEHRRFLIIFLINFTLKEYIDLYITPLIIIYYDGLIVSTIFSILIYLIIGIVSLDIYDLLEIDIFWIEALKKARKEGINFRKRNCLIKFILKNNKKKQFIFDMLLSFKNLALMVINKRDGEYLFNGFTNKKIKLLFVVYLILINIYWNLMVYYGISLGRILWDFIKIIFN